MKLNTSTAVALALAGVIGLGALTPAAYAQQAPQPPQMDNGMQMPHPNFGNHNGGDQFRGGQFRGEQQFRMRDARRDDRGGRGTLLELTCGPNAAERMEIGFVRLSYRLDLTAEQQALFDDLKASALTAQTQFADQCPTPSQPGADQASAERPTTVERLQGRIDSETLHTSLLSAILPKLEAFYNSLTDEQKASLEPQQRQRGDRHPGMDQQGQLPAPPAAPDAAQPEPTADELPA